MNEFNFDAFVDNNVLDSDWMSIVSQIDIPGDWFTADAYQGLEFAPQLEEHMIESDAQTTTFEDWLTLDGPTDTLDPSPQDAGCGLEPSGRRPNQETNQGKYFPPSDDEPLRIAQ